MNSNTTLGKALADKGITGDMFETAAPVKAPAPAPAPAYVNNRPRILINKSKEDLVKQVQDSLDKLTHVKNLMSALSDADMAKTYRNRADKPAITIKKELISRLNAMTHASNRMTGLLTNSKFFAKNVKSN